MNSRIDKAILLNIRLKTEGSRENSVVVNGHLLAYRSERRLDIFDLLTGELMVVRSKPRYINPFGEIQLFELTDLGLNIYKTLRSKPLLKGPTEARVYGDHLLLNFQNRFEIWDLSLGLRVGLKPERYQMATGDFEKIIYANSQDQLFIILLFPELYRLQFLTDRIQLFRENR